MDHAPVLLVAAARELEPLESLGFENAFLLVLVELFESMNGQDFVGHGIAGVDKLARGVRQQVEVVHEENFAGRGDEDVFAARVVVEFFGEILDEFAVRRGCEVVLLFESRRAHALEHAVLFLERVLRRPQLLVHGRGERLQQQRVQP